MGSPLLMFSPSCTYMYALLLNKLVLMTMFSFIHEEHWSFNNVSLNWIKSSLHVRIREIVGIQEDITLHAGNVCLLYRTLGMRKIIHGSA